MPLRRLWLLAFLIAVLTLTLLFKRNKIGTTIDSPDVSAETVLKQNSLKTCQTRLEFFERIQSIEVGMSKNDVIERIGSPDDVVFNYGYQAVYALSVNEVWQYGNSSEFRFPTFGRIEFDKSESVSRIVGASGIPFVCDDLNEQKLRFLLEQLNNMQGLNGSTFDPHKLVKLVNEFQPLEQKLSFDVVREYVRIAGYNGKGTDEFLLLLSCLFELPRDGFFPRFPIGLAIPNPPVDHRDCPRFPIKFIDGIPLLMIYGSGGTGTTSIEDLVKLFEGQEWRQTQIPINKEPLARLLESLTKYSDSSGWYFDGSETEPMFQLLKDQIRRYAKNR